MKNKNLVSLTIGFAFLAMSITGILLYFKQKAHFIEITHTIIGLVFTGFAIFHIKNNWDSITGYSKSRKTGKIQKELIWSGVIALVIVVGGLTEILEPVAEVGKLFASGGKGGGRPPFLNEVQSNEKSSGKAFDLVLVKNKGSEESDVAVWVEDTASHAVESLLVGQKFTTANQLKPNVEKPIPFGSILLSSKISAAVPCIVKVEVKKGDKSEVYQARITSAEQAAAFSLSGNSKEFVKTAVISFH